MRRLCGSPSPPPSSSACGRLVSAASADVFDDEFDVVDYVCARHVLSLMRILFNLTGTSTRKSRSLTRGRRSEDRRLHRACGVWRQGLQSFVSSTGHGWGRAVGGERLRCEILGAVCNYTEFVGAAVDDWGCANEISDWGWRRQRPFEGGGTPGIFLDGFAASQQAGYEINEEYRLSGNRYQGCRR